MTQTKMKCEEFKNSYSEFSHLWVKEVDDAFEDFLNNESLYPKEDEEGEKTEGDEKEDEAPLVSNTENPIMKGIRQHMPDIIHFEEEINKLYGIKNRIMNKKSNNDIQWLRVQSSPLRDTLLERIKAWTAKWTNFLQENVQQKQENIDVFTEYIRNGIVKNPNDDPDDKELLYKVMGCIREMNRQ